MRPSRVVLLAALTVVGGTILARKVPAVSRIPGFAPHG